MKKIFKLITVSFLLVSLSLSLPLLAEELNGEEKSRPLPELTDEKISAKKTLPDSSQKKEQAETFIRFVPTEDIRAAKAVPFPVDI